MANGASALILRWKVQFACAVVWWAAAVASCFGSDAQSMIVFLVAIFLCQIVFGIYGVIGYSTAQRTQEIGIRIALGARPRDVTRMVLRSGLLLAVVGLGAGMLLFLAAGRIVESLLYGVSPRDPITLIGASLLVALIALVASYAPARRAARIDPIVALRTE